MGAEADRQAFADRQAALSKAHQPTRTPEQLREDRIEALKGKIAQRTDQAFNDERFADRDKGALASHNKETQDKGGVKEQPREDRIENLKSKIAERTDQAFNGERFGDRDKGSLSVHHKNTQDKGGIDR